VFSLDVPPTRGDGWEPPLVHGLFSGRAPATGASRDRTVLIPQMNQVWQLLAFAAGSRCVWPSCAVPPPLPLLADVGRASATLSAPRPEPFRWPVTGRNSCRQPARLVDAAASRCDRPHCPVGPPPCRCSPSAAPRPSVPAQPRDRMIRHGASIPEIAEVLRHHAASSTMIYAKVDALALDRAAAPTIAECSRTRDVGATAQRRWKLASQLSARHLFRARSRRSGRRLCGGFRHVPSLGCRTELTHVRRAFGCRSPSSVRLRSDDDIDTDKRGVSDPRGRGGVDPPPYLRGSLTPRSLLGLLLVQLSGGEERRPGPATRQHATTRRASSCWS
jgi:hypothetical protein